MKLSAIVITKNEATNIERCLASLSFADEVIVVDDFSTDETVAIATKLGAAVLQRQFTGYGAQKNAGLAAAHGEWVLFVDADEEISPELAQSITKTITQPTFGVYWVKVLDIFLGKKLQHTTGNNPRLFRKAAARWSDRAVHERVELIGPISQTVHLGDAHSGVLDGFLIHHSHASIQSYLKKMHRYTSLDAEQMHETNRHRSGRVVTANILLPSTLAIRQFIKLAFWRRGILDGYAGCMWALLSAYYEWEMARKYNKLNLGHL